MKPDSVVGRNSTVRVARLLPLALAASLTAGLAGAQTLGLGTTAPGGLVHSNGVAVAKVLVEKGGLKVVVQPRGGTSERDVNAGNTQISLTNSMDLLFFLSGTGTHEGDPKHDGIRIVTPLMASRIAGWVRKDSDIKSIKDVKDKRFPAGFTQQKIMLRVHEGLLANAGISYGDVKRVATPSIARSQMDFVAGNTDIFFFTAGTARVKQASAAVGGLRPIAVDTSAEAVARMKKLLPHGYVFTLKPNKRDPLITEPTPVLSYDLVLYVNTKLPDEVVYKIAKAMHDNKKVMVDVFGGLRQFQPKEMARQYEGLKHHPGAIKYYKEIGIWPADGV